MSKLKKRILIIAVPAIILGFISVTIFSNITKKEEKVPAVASPVILSNPESGTIERTLYYSGTLMPKKTITVISKVAGKIEKIFVKAGDLVTKEQSLVQIEDESVNFQMNQAYSMWEIANAQLAKAKKGVRREELDNAKALVKQAEKDLDLAKENFERTARLYEGGAIAKSKYDEAENMIKSAETTLENAGRSVKLMEQGASDEEIKIALANADAAKAQYNLAQLQVGFTSLEASVVGMVASVLTEEGNMVGPSTPILAVVNINPIIAKIPVPEMYYGEMLQKYENIKVRVYPNAYPGIDAFTGIITGMAPIIDAASRTFTVDVEISNPYRLLRPGMYANVEIVMDTFEKSMLVPKTAVVKRNGKDVVFVAVNGNSIHSKTVEVKLGIENDDQVRILSGISFEDRVIVEGNLFLEDGQEVRVVE